MKHLPYIIAAFAIATAGMAWLFVSSYLAMRRAEKSADSLRNRD